MTANLASPDPHTDLALIEGLADRLRSHFATGATRPLAWREAQLRQLKKMMAENADAFVEALQADLGKPTLEAYTSDVAIVSGEVDLALKQLKRWTRPRKARTPAQTQPAKSFVVAEPLGVALIISPWNYPVQLLLSPLVGAIAAGNCAALKPSEVSAHVSELLARLVPEYLDPDAFAIVEGAVEETTALLEQRWDHVFYTGNGAVARVVMAAAAKHLTPVTLELGGKSPCIVAPDAKLEVAARRIAWAKFLNAGQTCIAPDYVLVHESREQELLDRLAAAIRDFYGEDPQRSPDFARICNVRHHRRLLALLKDGGEVYAGGQSDEEDRYIAPTLLRGPAEGSAVMGEEIFGPLLPVLTVPDVDTAIDFVNRRDKPLALYVFTEDRGVEERVIASTSSGGVCVNAAIWHVANPHLPFGGVGESGMGAYHGGASFEAFSHSKSVLRKSTKFDLKFMYPPYTDFKTNLVKKML